MTQLKDLTTVDVITVSVDASIDEAVRLFEQHHVRHLPVLRDGQPVGMVTVGDVLKTVGGLLSDQRVSTQDATVPYAGPTVVEQIMTTGIVSLSPDESIVEAARLMLERQIATVILVLDGTITGMVTEKDYLQQFFGESTVVPEACRQQPVADHMATDVVTASPSENVFALMRDMGQQIHHLPVVEDGKLVGILSDHDVRRALALNKIEQIIHPELQNRLIEEGFNAGGIMSKNVETTTPTATLQSAARRLTEKEIGALPVLEGETLAGIITETDILRACVNVLEES